MRITKRELKQYITECVREVIRERRLFESVNSEISTDDLIKKSDEPFLPYVDLGYGLKFAKCNLGASSPEEYGLYFQWGEIEGHKPDEKEWTWDTCPWGEGETTITTLDAEHDAATQMLGKSWRMPTKIEFKMLFDENKFDNEWTQVKGVIGRKFTSKYNGNSIFIPASGYCYGSSLKHRGEECFYWTSIRAIKYSGSAYFLYQNSKGWNVHGDMRCYGCVIRPVFIG